MYINDFYKYGRVYKVQLEGDPRVRMKPSDFDLIFVRNAKGNMIPLNTVVDTKFTTGPDNLTHFNGYDAIKVMGTCPPGVSSGETMAALEKLAAEKLYPDGLDFAWSDVSYQEKKASSDSYKIFAFALLMVFLVLAAQYESWSIPLAVIVAVPVGVFGALLAIFFRGLPNDIYFQIGLITLIGLAAKNAILIVEFANTRVASGMELVAATVEACRLRIRPIVMTSLAFILGVLPLVIATGAGAAGRHAIGTGVFGGMLAATFLAVLFVPLFFVLIYRFTGMFKRRPLAKV
jgi:HAE1 family hydrophobic/amphiphilic exporter-1/multidrug efflux pump